MTRSLSVSLRLLAATLSALLIVQFMLQAAAASHGGCA